MKLVGETLNENINFERTGNVKSSVGIGNSRMTEDGKYMKEATPEKFVEFVEDCVVGNLPNDNDLHFHDIGKSNGWKIWYLALYKPMHGINDFEGYVMSNGPLMYFWNFSNPYLIYSGEREKYSIGFDDNKLYKLIESWDEDGSVSDFSTVVDVVEEIDSLIW